LKIYRYYSNRKYFRDVFQKCSLYFNSLNNFNDPYEIFTFAQIKNSNEVYYDDECKDPVKACCFSKEYSNYLLWSHYAKSHEGYCIEFDFSKYLQKENEHEDLFFLTLENKKVYAFSIVYNTYNIQAEKKSNNKFNFQQTINIVSHKNKIWDYEKEYRLITSSKESLNLKIPKDVITGVYYGLKVSDNDIKKEEKYISRLGYNIFHRKLSLGINKEELVLDYNFV
jgi:hypothetical protein